MLNSEIFEFIQNFNISSFYYINYYVYYTLNIEYIFINI